MKTPVPTSLPTDVPNMVNLKKKSMDQAIGEANQIRAEHRKDQAARTAGIKATTLQDGAAYFSTKLV
jgi:hypothetical protein